MVQAFPQTWAIALEASLCSSHYEGRTEIVSTVLMQTSLMNLCSYIVVMNYKDWQNKFQFCLQQTLEDSISLFYSFITDFHCVDLLSLTRGLCKKL